jgi:hypothetical protein
MTMPEKRTIAVVTACMTRAGFPEFVLNEVAVTEDEIENGIHFYLAEANALEAGYEEPFVNFDEEEAPDFLLAGVRQYLGLPPVRNAYASPTSQEETSCAGSSK